MSSVARLWSPRNKHRLSRHWISFENRIVISGEGPAQAGTLSVQPTGQGGLRARLQVMGRKYEELVSAGNDIAVWINGLNLFVRVTAVEDARRLVAFGIPPGSTVNLALEQGTGIEDDASACPRGYRRIYENGAGCPIGLCQTQP